MQTTGFYKNHVRYAWLAREDERRCRRKAIAEPSMSSHWNAMALEAANASYRHEAEASLEFHHGPAMERLKEYARRGRRVPAPPAPVPPGTVGEAGKVRAYYQRRLAGTAHNRHWVWAWITVRDYHGKTEVLQLVEHEDLWTLRGIVAHYTRWDCRAYRNN
jgi:hypothetical protein